jgi:hypothetical protein
MLSTSGVLLKIRPEPDSLGMEAYQTQAKQYVLEVLERSAAVDVDRSADNLLGVDATEPVAHWRDTYLSYVERVKLANPLVQDGKELKQQVATLLRADGRSHEEAAAILRGSNVLVSR